MPTPPTLNALPPVERAKKTVAYMGGAAAAIARAQADFASGEYRWVADVMSQVVFAEPDNRSARELGADALERLGYQSESATWRNAYLQGARELRVGMTLPATPSRAAEDIVRGLSLDLFFNVLGARLKADEAEGMTAIINWEFPDTRQRCAMTLKNCALTYLPDRHAQDADCTVSLERATLNRLVLRELALPEALAQGAVRIDGDGRKLAQLLGLLHEFSLGFAIIEPVRAKREVKEASNRESR
jgi:linear primary-alkylsulfatase